MKAVNKGQSKNFSLTFRLIAAMTGLALLIGIAAGIVSWREAKESADEFFDTYQMALARSLASADWTHINPEIQKLTNKALKHIRNADDDHDAVGFAVFNHQGEMVFHDNENGRHIEFKNNMGSFENEKVDDDFWRIIRIQSADGKHIIAVGQELEYRSGLAWDLIEEFMIPWISGITVMLFIILLVIYREFSPLRHTASEVDNRSDKDLSPLPMQGLPNEVLPLVNAVNKLFEKVGLMIERERRFVADAAHELRTPLTALKVQLEVMEMSKDDELVRRKAVNNLVLGLNRAERLVEQLLALSRLEENITNSASKEILLDWEKIITQVLACYDLEIKDKNLKIDMKILGQPPFVKGNPDLVSLMVKNLLENAIKYSPDTALVEINVIDYVFSIINSGAMVDEKHIEKLTDRFYRVPGQNEKGSGLGLSIVKFIAESYCCTVKFTNTQQGFKVCITQDNEVQSLD